jgi:hypothetical protein
MIPLRPVPVNHNSAGLDVPDLGQAFGLYGAALCHRILANDTTV